MRRLKYFIAFLIFIPTVVKAQRISTDSTGSAMRAYMVDMLTTIADPVLVNLSHDRLKTTMPVEVTASPWGDRNQVTYLEAFGRTLMGIAPWLELGPDESEEGQLREKYIQLALKCIDNATNPNAADFMNFTEGGQPLVDAAFFAEALVRAPNQLWGRLDNTTRQNVLQALKSTRSISPAYSNWLLFTGMIEAALLKFEGEADMVRLEYALNKTDEWYLGDGMYGDGPNFHWDYYNSYVIQPMLLDILGVLKEKKAELGGWNYRHRFIYQSNQFLERAQRYAVIQERLISPEGTYPPIGRSLPYRVGAFQLLSQIALMQELPAPLTPAQVRGALYAIIKNQMEAPNTFDENGWLKIGFYGHQPDIAEGYLSTGSLYLCTAAFLVLGLPEGTPFWSAPSVPWTQKAIWSGKNIPIDRAYYPSQQKSDNSQWEEVIGPESFKDAKQFRKAWNYHYPWGAEHNGAAKMHKRQIVLKDQTLHIKATPVSSNEGKSKHPPYQEIKYLSGAIHAKHQITISEAHPTYTISGEFKAPIQPGTWPAFWLTAVNGWPPESDIMEFKGDDINWQNTFITPKEVTTIKTSIPDAMESWHTYTAVLQRVDDEHTTITYYIDGNKKGVHWTNFTNKPLWLIINLQMEGSSGSPGPTNETDFFIRNVSVKRK